MSNERYAFPAAAANGADAPVTVEQAENVPTTHRATLVPSAEFIRFRTHRHRFGSGVHVVWGVKPKSKAGPRGGVVYVHAVLFDAKLFSPVQAKKWLKHHRYSPIRFVPAVQEPDRHIARGLIRRGQRVANPRRAAKNVLPEGVAYHYLAMNPQGPKTLNEAIKLVRNNAPSPVARAYADAAMRSMVMYGIGGVVNQMHYVLNNTQTWRGPLALETKKFIRAWIEAQGSAAKASNPSLMILTNPHKETAQKPAISNEVRLAQKAYKSFHFRDVKRTDKRKVPDGWPKVYVVLGDCDAFEVKTDQGKVRKAYGSSKPILACTKDRKDVFIFSRNGRLGIPAGTAVRVEYSVPAHSGRNKWAKSWYHPHESNPKVTTDKTGRAVRISGPGLSVSPRGIIG